MKKRVILLSFLLLLRIVIGFIFLNQFVNNGNVNVYGNIFKVTQSDNKCIVYFGFFIASVKESCKVRKGDQVAVFGRPVLGLTEALMGKISLEEAVIKKVDNSQFVVMRQEKKFDIFQAILNYCNSVYQSLLPKDEASLLAGIVLGDKSNIGQGFYQQLVKSGTIHIAVASGYNLMLVGGTVLSLLFWLVARKRATAMAIGIMLFYAILAGFEPPVVRALLMSSLLFLSAIVGRKLDSVWYLFLSAWAMLVWDMSLLWSVSFQLSVMASAGLMVLSPWIMVKMEQKGLDVEAIWLEKIGLITTVCTMLMTAPVIWWHFGRISLIGLFSNVLILPLVPTAMILGVFMLILPQVFFVPTYALLHLMVLIIRFFGS